MKRLKFIAKDVLRSFGLEVRRIGVDPSEGWLAGADPLTCQYLSDLAIAPLVQIQIGDAIAGVSGFSCVSESGHPLIAAFEAARCMEEPAKAEDAIRGALLQYYEVVRPKSAAEVLGLTEPQAPGLAGEPLHHWVFPWSERTKAGIAAHRRTCLEEEALHQGLHLTLEDGGTFYGPVSAGKLDLEVTRIHGLCQSMTKHGYRGRNAQPLEVIGLRTGAAYRWLIIQGQHRLAACVAFGVSEAEARVARIIRREDASYWPHVVAGTFTLEGALACFDRLYSATPFAAASQWLALRKSELAASTTSQSRGRNGRPPAIQRQVAAQHDLSARRQTLPLT
jgi:hypothetical protein